MEKKKTKKIIKDSEEHTAETMGKMLAHICYRMHSSNGETAAVKAVLEKITKKQMSNFTEDEYANFIKEILEAR